MVTTIPEPLVLSAPALAPARRVFLLRTEALNWLGLRSVLVASPEVILVGEACTRAEAVAGVGELLPDLVVLPGSFAGRTALALISQLRAQAPATRFVVILDRIEPHRIGALAVPAIEACLLWSDVTPGMFHRVLISVTDDNCVVGSRAVREAFFDALRGRAEDSALPDAPTLTPRQQQVLALLAAGLSDKALAAQLDLSASTVASHIQELSAALGAANRFQIGWLAHAQGLLPRDSVPVGLARRRVARGD